MNDLRYQRNQRRSNRSKRIKVDIFGNLLYLWLAEQTNDPRLFKKLQSDIWEFRTQYAGIQIRLLAFWDKTDGKETLVFATHGFIKKVDKVPSKEIERAVKIKERYFQNKSKK